MDDTTSKDYCSRYLDDAPGMRGDCAQHLAKGRDCVDCPHRNIRAEVKNLRKSVGILNNANRFLSEQLVLERGTGEPAAEESAKPFPYEDIRHTLSSTVSLQLPDKWIPLEEAALWCVQRLMVNGSDYLPAHWACKYVNIRVDLRTGHSRITPGNLQREVKAVTFHIVQNAEFELSEQLTEERAIEHAKERARDMNQPAYIYEVRLVARTVPTVQVVMEPPEEVTSK